MMVHYVAYSEQSCGEVGTSCGQWLSTWMPEGKRPADGSYSPKPEVDLGYTFDPAQVTCPVCLSFAAPEAKRREAMVQERQAMEAAFTKMTGMAPPFVPGHGFDEERRRLKAWQLWRRGVEASHAILAAESIRARARHPEDPAVQAARAATDRELVKLREEVARVKQELGAICGRELT